MIECAPKIGIIPARSGLLCLAFIPIRAEFIPFFVLNGFQSEESKQLGRSIFYCSIQIFFVRSFQDLIWCGRFDDLFIDPVRLDTEIPAVVLGLVLIITKYLAFDKQARI